MSNNAKTMPPKMMLTAAGNHANLPNAASDISIDGIISDHIEAATMIPPAMPNKKELMLCEMSFLKKKTNDAPNVVIRNMIEKPIIVNMVLFIIKSTDYGLQSQILFINSKLLTLNY